MDIREAIAKAKDLHPDANAQEVLTTLIRAAEEIAPERRLVPHDGYGRRKRTCAQVNNLRKYTRYTLKYIGRRHDDKRYTELPFIERKGPTDRRKAQDEGAALKRGVGITHGGRSMSPGRRYGDKRWDKLPPATPPMSEAERRARRAVAAIPGAEFRSMLVDCPLYSDEGMLTSREVDAINDLLDRCEAAEKRLVEVEESRNLIIGQRDQARESLKEAQQEIERIEGCYQLLRTQWNRVIEATGQPA